MILKRIIGWNERDNEPYIQWYNTDSPNVSDYIKKRLEPQLKWYDSKSRTSMYRHYSLQLLTIFFGVIIPVINIVDLPNNDFAIRIISSILASIIVGITGLLQLTIVIWQSTSCMNLNKIMNFE